LAQNLHVLVISVEEESMGERIESMVPVKDRQKGQMSKFIKKSIFLFLR